MRAPPRPDNLFVVAVGIRSFCATINTMRAMASDGEDE
jgi:hypothetical protein